jgi:hypothetical protein
MTPEMKWELVYFGAFAVSMVTSLLLMLARRPRSLIWRSVLAIAGGWGVSVLYTANVYNPAGIAYFRLLGVDSPEMRFDNNTVAVSLIGGWLYPSLVVGAIVLSRTIMRRRQIHG